MALANYGPGPVSRAFLSASNMGDPRILPGPMICGHTVTSLLQGALVIPWKHLLVEVKPKCPCHDLKLKGTKAVPQELEAEMALLWPAITKLAQRYRDATEERDRRQRLTQARIRWRSLCEFHCDLEFHLSYDKRTYNLELNELMGEQKGL